jgi:MGT family glycosyltransferase
MKLIFCLLPEQGHINPFIGPAQALQQMGHEVLICSPGDLSEQMNKCGLPFSKDLIAPASSAPPRGKQFMELIEDRANHVMLIEQFFMNGIVPQVPAIKAWLEKEAPDGVIIDPMNYAAVIAAHLLNIPWVGMSSSLTSVIPHDMKSDVLDILKEVLPKRNAIFRSFGFEPQFRAVDCLSPLLNISFSTKAFIQNPPSEVELVGPSKPLHKRGDEVLHQTILTDMPLVYVSFGSQVFYYPQVFRKIISACHDLPIRLVMSIGDLALEPGWESTDKVQFYQYAPQLEILKQASLFVTHGGANSVMEGICADVPLLVTPICNDQDHQAYFVKQSGIGESLDFRTASTEEIRKSIQDLLENESIRSTMKTVSATYQENGALKAAHLVEAAISRKKH